MKLLYVLSIIAICSAQEATEFVKLNSGNEAKTQKPMDSLVEPLLREVGELGMLLENYRRVILSGITEASDICGFIEKLSVIEDPVDKIADDRLTTTDEMGIKLYKSFFQKVDDPILKQQLFSTLENHIDNCYEAGSTNLLLAKRDKSQVQKIRFHSWGGKRNRGAPKVVIRTPFHSWGGKRSGKDV